MVGEEWSFQIKVVCFQEYERKTFSDEIRLRLLNSEVTSWNTFGGSYRKSLLVIEKEHLYEKEQPPDFDTNFPWSLWVHLQGKFSHDVTFEILYEQINLARELTIILKNMGCRVETVFMFTMPDDSDPRELL